jgi:hypothetical protein
MDFDLGGVRKQGADDEAGFVAERVHAQQRVGRLVRQLNQAAKFVFGQQHDDKRLAEVFCQGTLFIPGLLKNGVAAFGRKPDNSTFPKKCGGLPTRRYDEFGVSQFQRFLLTVLLF